ncbi:two-component system, OmpR family, phosphate regulon response regulator PhoB [Desulfurobacterium pacificum]|jgi:DNA-binding response OmpR family regulator|uniref:Two-component system, OmpR family, phosphate regulon response regulator PhoB n=1 Tax=Desulfurobacterium pacificum TaxID=240166 RepID=A0ABY1NKH6_9BACT|nr:response regulator transcription factor [Desulfurobacterium pacificum]SMP11153.1 two-component system, OmpR family, phosphate regulon response regulator PhoB [Desulfurobacterium pacificum]
MLVLLAEDDKDLGDLVKYNLEKNHFKVDWILDGEEAAEKVEKVKYDLAILDLMLPGLDGLEICKRIRRSPKNRDIPVIILTALSSEDTKLKGFSAGADDYVTKPFSMKELLARIEAVLRRAGHVKKDVLEFEGIKLDRKSKSVTVDGEPIYLTKTELQLLEFFLEHPEELFSREELLEKIWGADHNETTRTVDVYISRLRKKLGEKGKYLRTLPRLGYKLTKE